MRKILIGCLIAVVSICTSACDQKQQTAAEEVTGTQTEKETESGQKKENTKEAAMEVLGTDTEGSVRITIENATGHTITGLAVRDSFMDDFGEDLMTGKTPMKSDEKRILCYEAKDENEGAIEPNAMFTSVQYDLCLTFDDGQTKTITGFPFSDAQEVKLCFGDDVTYVEYRSKDTGENISSKESELALKKQLEIEAEAARIMQEKAEE